MLGSMGGSQQMRSKPRSCNRKAGTFSPIGSVFPITILIAADAPGQERKGDKADTNDHESNSQANRKMPHVRPSRLLVRDHGRVDSSKAGGKTFRTILTTTRAPECGTAGQPQYTGL